MRPEWKIRETHERDIQCVLREQGCLDSRGRLRAWFGRRSLDALAAKGHSAVGFDQCDCRHADTGEGA